jgi:hypothetical protein
MFWGKTNLSSNLNALGVLFSLFHRTGEARNYFQLRLVLKLICLHGLVLMNRVTEHKIL